MTFNRIEWLKNRIQEIDAVLNGNTNRDAYDFDSCVVNVSPQADTTYRDAGTMQRNRPAAAMALPIPEQDAHALRLERNQFSEELRAIENRDNYPGAWRQRMTTGIKYSVNGKIRTL